MSNFTIENYIKGFRCIKKEIVDILPLPKEITDIFFEYDDLRNIDCSLKEQSLHNELRKETLTEKRYKNKYFSTKINNFAVKPKDIWFDDPRIDNYPVRIRNKKHPYWS